LVEENGVPGENHRTVASMGVVRIMEKYRHKLFRRADWDRSMGSMVQNHRKLTGYTTDRVTFLIIFEVLLTT
jgi:hypothetical protein